MCGILHPPFLGVQGLVLILNLCFPNGNTVKKNVLGLGFLIWILVTLTCKKHSEAQTFYQQFVVMLSTSHPALQIFLLLFPHTALKLLEIVTHLTVKGSHRLKHGTQYQLANPGITMEYF